MKPDFRLTIGFLLAFFLFAHPAIAETAMKANPDCFSTGLSWTFAGIPSVKVGDVISFPRVLIGGMLEARNEARFNQAALPNHNWRGVCRLEATVYERPAAPATIALRAGLSHESAHPTMGIREATDKSLDLIYDDVYRRMILNALSLSCLFADSGAKATFLARADGHFYFLSKNTPELAGSALGAGGGLSIGLEYRYRLGRHAAWFFSVHDRLIVRGLKTDQNYVHLGNGASLRNVLTSYPVINESNTVVAKSGASFFPDSSSRILDVYLRVLYGGIYGFVDSRDKRLVASAGVEFSL
jgi:hypothetical protein